MMVRLRTDSFAPLLQLREEFDRVYKNLFRDGGVLAGSGKSAGHHPPLNFWEDENSLKIEAELPGLKAEDLDLTVLGSELTIQGRVSKAPQEGQTFHRRERETGEFRRVVRLPVDVEGDKIVATLNDGVLLITLPKAAGAKPKKIKVSAG
jgi:HSP20 family protein